MGDRFACPPHHRHEVTTWCYNSHRCRCEPCRTSRSENGKYIRRQAGADIKTDSAPTVRRLRALACIGWSLKRIAAEMGGPTWGSIGTIRSGEQPTVYRSTAKQIREFYDRVHMHPVHDFGSQQARGWAAKHGWLAPLDWADIEHGIIQF